MNGARALIRTLVDCGVDTCFMNPGTSEMHFVAALDQVPEMRSTLVLYEGVATGGADGYARMAGRPAATLLHLGPGLGNGLANLHNARRAHTPMVNIVGDHATYHQQYDAPLQSDIDSLAANVSGWVRFATRPDDVARDAAEAVDAAMGPPGRVASLVLPADTSWLESAGPSDPLPSRSRQQVPDSTIADVAKALRSGEPAALLLGGSAMLEDGLLAGSRVAATTGTKLLAETFPARVERGAGLPSVERLGYLAEFAIAQLDGLAHLVLVDARAPVSFFAYPDKPSYLVPDGCQVHVLAEGADDAVVALQALADAVGAPPDSAVLQPASRPDRPTGTLNAETIAAAIGALLPDGAIVADEGNTAGLFVSGMSAGAPRHDWLCLTGGAIGDGLPMATGAALACPDRKVVCLEADGSAMYNLQSLWTQAREGLDVTTVIFNNRSYAILNLELNRVGAEPPGPRAQAMLDLRRPDLDFVALSRGMGVQATRAESADDFVEQFERAVAEPGPHLIDATLPSAL
jgi:acetolactate synthase-1/2/3 large subunit